MSGGGRRVGRLRIAESTTGDIVGEVELLLEDQASPKPVKIAEERTGDPRSFNANLIARPHSIR